MNDWEKYQLGLEPVQRLQQWPAGRQRQLRLSDYAYVTNLLASQNVITITATDPTATQPDPGAVGDGHWDSSPSRAADFR